MILVFDIETIPDIASGKKLYALEDNLEPAAIAELMFSQRRQESSMQPALLRLHLQRIAAISCLYHDSEELKLWSLGTVNTSEKELISEFFTLIERHTPKLVSWNGSGFDLPVLHYRALLHGVSCPRYWENGDEEQSFRWNNYLSRYHERHTDVMDILAGYNPRNNAPLDQIALMLGLPGKMGMSGSQVWQQWLAGKQEDVRNYCETDVLNTWLVYLHFEKMRGRMNANRQQHLLEKTQQLLQHGAGQYPHWQQFLQAWQPS